MVSKAENGAAAPWEVIGTSLMVPSSLKVMGSAQTRRQVFPFWEER